MRHASPTFTLVSLLAAAALVLGSGWRLALRNEDRHLPLSGPAMRLYATGLQRELVRLEALFQLDLRTLAGETATANDAQVRELCNAYYGVVQWSRLGKNPAHPNQHLAINPASGVALPTPALAGATTVSTDASALILPAEEPSPTGDAPDFGWYAPGDARYWLVWKRIGPDAMDVFLIDREIIISRVDHYLAEWLARPLAKNPPTSEIYRVESPRGVNLLDLSRKSATRAPDMVLPLVSRFGDWQVVAWDQVTTLTRYDLTTLGVSGVLSGILALLGIVLFFQQKRAARIAEQRVSFVNRVSHELGTPLTNILLNLDLIETDDSPLPASIRQRLSLVSEEARRLSRLVGNVLTFSRQERKRLQTNPLPHVPDELIAAVLQQFQPALQRRGIQTEWCGAAKENILVDGDAFAQILSNLLSNVEKYAASGRHLAIESRIADGQLLIRVTDRGPGIPATHIDRIFEPFERVASRVNEGSTGAGLGLAIARELAEMMGGRLRLLASAHGAVFELTLPAEPL